MNSYADNPQLWRDRAEEARIQAEQMSNDHSRETMLRIADSYDLMAEKAEARIAAAGDRAEGSAGR